MIYICTDVEDENDKYGCKNKQQKYNQCCQNCNDVKTCTKHCDYAHYHNCCAKKEFN